MPNKDEQRSDAFICGGRKEPGHENRIGQRKQNKHPQHKFPENIPVDPVAELISFGSLIGQIGKSFSVPIGEGENPSPSGEAKFGKVDASPQAQVFCNVELYYSDRIGFGV